MTNGVLTIINKSGGLKSFTRLLLLLVCAIWTISATAQTRNISGTVTDEAGDPMPGVAVMIKSTSNGVATDIDGKYAIKAKTGDILEFTYIGYLTQSVTVGERSVINITMKEDIRALDEVVVVAYGTQKKSSITGSISQVNSEKISVRPVSSVASALEGSTTGITVSGSYGAPGESPTIRIRGIGTVNGSTSPLYVIDGVPFGGNISDLNPEDIESMSVLKDAASAALYGNRAANGVILITTKKANTDRTSFTFKTNQGVYQRATPEYDRVGIKDYMHVEYLDMFNNYINKAGNGRTPEALTAAHKWTNEHLISDRLYTNIFNVDDDKLFDSNGYIVNDATIKGTYGEDLDWFDQTIHNGYRAEYLFSGSGATAKSDYYFSLGYLSEDGYLKNSGFKRFSGRASINMQPVKWLRTGFNINATHQKLLNSKGVGDDNTSYINPFYYCRYMAPIYPVYLHDPKTGEYMIDESGNRIYDIGLNEFKDGTSIQTREKNANRHIIWETQLNSNNTIRNTMNAIAYADIILPYGVTATVKGNLNTRNSEQTEMKSKLIGDSKDTGSLSKIIYNYKNWTFQQQLRWHYDFNAIHTVDVLLGHENYEYLYDYTYNRKDKESFSNIPALSNYSVVNADTGFRNVYRTESWLARLQYNYDDRYNLEGSFRRDGSSRFAPGHKWGNFGSVGANWVFSNEAFMKDFDWLQFGKLRADWGQVGNDQGSEYYAYMALYGSSSSGTNAGNPAYWITQLPATELTWETSESWGVGLELRMFNRWNLSAEYYDKRNKGLLFDVYGPNSAGSTEFKQAQSILTENFGTISNRGIEINTDVDIYATKDWTVNFAANLTTLKNKVIELPKSNKDGIQTGSYKIVEGKSRYEWYTYHWEGVDQMTGRSLYTANLEDYYYMDNGVRVGGTAVDADGNDAATEIPDDQFVLINGKPYVMKTTYASRKWCGTALPSVYGSFTGNVRWKNLTLSAMFTYSLGGKIYDSNYASLMGTSSSTQAYHIDMLNSWNGIPEGMTETSPNRISKSINPMIDNALSSDNNAGGDRWLTNRDYLCFKNLNISYQFPREIIRKIDLQGLQLSFSAENLFTKTSRKGLEPSQSVGGGQGNYVAAARVYTFGLTVNL